MSTSTHRHCSRVVAVPASALLVWAMLIGVSQPSTAATTARSAPGPAIADTQSAPDEVGASAVAQAYGHAVAVDGATTQSEKVDAEPDGSMRLTLSSTPARIRRNGSWGPVDNTLVTAPDGSIAPKASPARVTLGGAGSRSVARLRAGAGSVSYGWNAPLPAPLLAGSTATYREVRPGVDLLAQVSATGVETSLVFKSRQAAAAGPVSLPLDVSGLAAAVDKSGAVSYADPSGAVVARTPAPRAWDARLGGSAARPGGGPVHAVPSALRTSTGTVLSTVSAAGGTMRASGSLTDLLQVPAALLNDPSTVYPLVLDPGLDCTNCGEGHHGYIENDSPSEIDSSWDGGDVHVGTFNGGASRTRGLYQFAQGSSHGATINKATLNLTEVDAWSTVARPVTVYKSGAFNTASVWPNPPVATSANAVSSSFAYGHDISHPVGLNVTGIVVDSANDPSASSYYFQFITSETDDYSWKEFAPAATLVVNFDRAPGTPAGRSVSGCSFQCSSPTMTRDATPTLTGLTSDPDGDNLRYDFEVWAGHSANPTARGAVGSVSGVASAHMASWTVTPTLPNGDWEYRVRAYDGRLYGPWSTGWVMFTVDTVAPAPPTLTPSGPVSTIKDSFAGAVGASLETVSIKSAATDHAWGYVYAMLPSGSAATYPANVTCNSSSNGYVTVCPGTVGAAASITVTPVDNISTLSAWTFDAAGNIHGTPATVSFYAQDDSTPRVGHEWLTGSGPVDAGGNPDTAPCPQEDVPDSAAAGLPLHLSGGACWGVDDGHLGPPPVGTLRFDGSAASATTAGPAIDTTKSFTVAAWVKAADASSTLVRPFLTEDGSAVSGFFLQNAGDHWHFCLPNTERAPFAGTCTSSVATTSSTVGTWMFVVGQWDAVNHQARLYVSTDGSASTPVVASHASVPASTGVVSVGRDKVGTSYRYFNGEIYHPAVLQGVLSSTQLNSLGQGDQPPSAL